MLKLLRHKGTQKKIYIFLALAVVLTFAVSGVIVGGIGNRAPSSVGKIDGRKISLQEYLTSYKAVDHQVAWIYGNRYKQVRQTIDFQREAWDRLLLLDHAKKENIKVSDEEVVDWLTSQGGFSDKGIFDKGFYQKYVREYLHMDIRQFEEEVRQMLRIRKISEKVRSQIKFTDEELKNLYAIENVERDIAYGILPWETQKTDIPPPSAKELENFYPFVQDDLVDSERIKIKYLKIPKEDSEKFKELFSAGKSGTLEETAKKYNLTIKETVFFSRDDKEITKEIPAEIMGFCFALPEGKETGWIKIDKGSFKILIEGKKPARPLSPEEADVKIKELWVKEKALEVALKKLKESRQKYGTDLEALLKEAGAGEVQKLEKFKKGQPLPNPKSSSAFEKTLETTKLGEISEAFLVPDGAVVLKLEKISPMDEKKFAEEKESFKRRLTEEKAEQAFTKLITQLRSKLMADPKAMKNIFSEE